MTGATQVLPLALLALSSTAAATLTVGQTFLTGGPDPRTGSNGWALTSHGVAEKLFTVNKKDEIVGQVAKSVAKVSDKVWDVALKAGYKFSDGTVVNAEHVAACLAELNKANSAATSSLGTMTVTAVDSVTVRIESTRVTHVMDAVLAEWVFAIYRKDSGGNYVFTGPYAIETFTDNHIDLVPNRHYDAAHEERQKIVLKKFADGDALAAAVEENAVDIAFHLPIHALAKLRKEGARVKSFEVGYHYMAFHNMDTLQDVRVRQAIDQVLNRVALAQALAGGHATRSLFPDFSPYYVDGSEMHGQEANAKALLDAAGWVVRNGKRVKDGEELTVRLVAYPHRPGLVIMQPVIAAQLEALGITVTTVLTTMEWSTTQKIIDDRSFDLLLWAQHTLPAGDPLWFLSSFFRSDGGNNHGNLKSAEVDKLLDELSVAEEHTARVAAAAAAQHGHPCGGAGVESGDAVLARGAERPDGGLRAVRVGLLRHPLRPALHEHGLQRGEAKAGAVRGT
eukprot:TRINITY_DN2627_c0_g2_i1.p1 TRINITY_DN2627_c0_g2~~TRINITY_DN2627_c0_g2_i1.p1  ORF type:complete len:508 (+),score=206.94 TRINITY_DN2627_c0_g2_i1:79-1602(+)